MTTVHEDFKICKVCGDISKHLMLGSTNSFGPPDLDTRPAEMERSTMHYWIQECPSCGYCAPDLSLGRKTYIGIVKGELYQNQLRNSDYPDLANRFICHSIIQKSIYKYEEVAWAWLNAAWVCDDNDKISASKLCRNSAVDSFQKVYEKNQDFMNEPKGAYHALMVDLFRRSEQFDKAGEEIGKGLISLPDKIIIDILLFHRNLIQLRDTKCYTMGDLK